MNGVAKSQRRLTKFAHIVIPDRWNPLNTCSTVVRWFNTGGNTLPTSFGNSLQIRRISARRSIFSMMQCFLNQPLCKTLKRFSQIWFFLRSGLPWIIWRQQNDLVFNNMQWHVEKTRRVISMPCRIISRTEWKRTLKDLEEAWMWPTMMFLRV
jgi:hypothetical protein